jgi:hypothetical protein
MQRRYWRRAIDLCAACIIASVAAFLVACGGGNTDDAARTSEASDTVTVVPAAPALVSNDGQLLVDKHAMIRERAIGPLRIGEWRRPVMSFVYVVNARMGRDSTSIILVHGPGTDTLSLSFANDTLREIFVTRPGARTLDGLQVGLPFSAVADRPDATTATRGKARIAWLNDLCGVRFATDSAALSPDSIVAKTAKGPPTIRAISVGYCTATATP